MSVGIGESSQFFKQQIEGIIIMDLKHILYLATLVLCIINYVLVLYSNKWDFGKTESVGWFMAVLGWFNTLM